MTTMCGLHKNTKAAGKMMCRMAGAHREGTSLLKRYWVWLAPLRRYLSDHPFKMANTGQELLDLFEDRALASVPVRKRDHGFATGKRGSELHCDRSNNGNLQLKPNQQPEV